MRCAEYSSTRILEYWKVARYDQQAAHDDNCGFASSPKLPMKKDPIEKEKKRKDYAFWRQFNEKPSIVPGCPGNRSSCNESCDFARKVYFLLPMTIDPVAMTKNRQKIKGTVPQDSGVS